MFFGDALTAADAERLGLVNRVVPDGELEKTARAWAERLATGPTRALALTKQLVNASLDTDRATAFAAEAAAQEINMTTADAQRGRDELRGARRPSTGGASFRGQLNDRGSRGRVPGWAVHRTPSHLTHPSASMDGRDGTRRDGRHRRPLPQVGRAPTTAARPASSALPRPDLRGRRRRRAAARRPGRIPAGAGALRDRRHRRHGTARRGRARPASPASPSPPSRSTRRWSPSWSRRTSTTWPRIARAGVFCVNVLGAHQGELCRGLRGQRRGQVRRGRRTTRRRRPAPPPRGRTAPGSTARSRPCTPAATI